MAFGAKYRMEWLTLNGSIPCRLDVEKDGLGDQNSVDFAGVSGVASVAASSANESLNTLSFGDGSTDSAFSVAVCVDMDDALEFMFIGRKTAIATYEWGLRTDPLGRLEFLLRDASTGGIISVKTTTLTPYENQEIKIIGTYTGSGTVEGLKLYVYDSLGNLLLTNSIDASTGSYTAMEPSGYDLYMAGVAVASTYTDGEIWNASIYDIELSDIERETVIKGELTGREVARWKYSEGVGSSLADDIGGFNASLSGGYAWTTRTYTPIALGHTIDALVHNYNATNPEEIVWVVGSEIVFSFVVTEGNTVGFDADFYESTYKTLRARFFVSGVEVWRGWVKPENTTREHDGPHVVYRISATDALNDLQNIDYEGYQNQGDEPLLQIIKNAVEFSGLGIANGFFVQSNFGETAIQNSLGLYQYGGEYYAHNAALYKVKNGETVVQKCFDVIERHIKPFYSLFFQSEGWYKIICMSEYNTVYTGYDYDTLAVLSAHSDLANDRRVSISDFQRPIDAPGELTKLAPIKKLKVYLYGRSLGNDAGLLNGDFSSGTTNWNNGPSNANWDNFAVVGGVLQVSEESGGDPDEDKIFYSDAFNIASIGSGSGHLHIKLDYELIDVAYAIGSTKNTIFLRVTVIYPDGSQIDSNDYVVQTGNTTLDLGNLEPTTFPLDQTGNYTLEVRYVPHVLATVEYVSLEFDNIAVTIEDPVDYISDRLVEATISADAHQEVTEELFLGIGNNTEFWDTRAIFDITETLTRYWERYGKSELELLRQLFCQQYLNDRRAYHDVVTIELYDFGNELKYDSILQFNSKTYRFIEMSKNYKTMLVTGTIVQVDNSSDVSVTFSETALTSQEGESTE